MGEFKAPVEQKNKTAAPVQEAKEASSLGEMEYVDSRASTFQLIQLQAAADDQGKGSRITQLQSKSAQFTGFSRVAQLQAKSYSKVSTTQPSVVQREENKTGLPDGLKSGMESISGMSLSDVKVHRNSDKPAQLQAHAYAQGTDIHLGPGQEKHLPHELGHVVQQKEGRVKPTMQLKGKININDDSGLEKEADVLGGKAQSAGMISETENDISTAQRMEKEVIQGKFTQGNVVQLVGFDTLPPDAQIKNLEEAKTGINTASKLSEIGAAIENSAIDKGKKDDGVKRLKNTDTGVNRAEKYFTSQNPPMLDEKKSFIDERYPLAVSDQKTIISKGIDEAITKIPEEPSFDSFVTTATRTGANSAKIFKPEVMNDADMQKTADVAKQKGGLSKVISVTAFFSKMDKELKDLWIEYSPTKNEDGAIKIFESQTVKNKELAIIPENAPSSDLRFAKFDTLAKAFSAPVMGCWGMADDYKPFKNMNEAIAAMGLDSRWYPKGAFIVTIPDNGLDQAVTNLKADKKALGKASVFSSLMWKEFNYMEKMRELNKTTSLTTDNDGVDRLDGKEEVMSTDFRPSDFFAQKPKYLGI